MYYNKQLKQNKQPIGVNMFGLFKKETRWQKFKKLVVTIVTYGGDKMFDQGNEDHHYNYMWF